jgi:hypothetical protein
MEMTTLKFTIQFKIMVAMGKTTTFRGIIRDSLHLVEVMALTIMAMGVALCLIIITKRSSNRIAATLTEQRCLLWGPKMATIR